MPITQQHSGGGRTWYLAVINGVSSPAHHIQDVVGLLGLAVDAVQDAVHCTQKHREVDMLTQQAAVKANLPCLKPAQMGGCEVLQDPIC